MNLRRIMKVAAAGAAVASLLALSACSGSTDESSAGSVDPSEFSLPAQKEGTLTVLTKYGNAKYAPYFDQVAKDYEKANPGVKVDLQNVADQPYKDKIKVLAAGNQLPDVYFAWPGAFAQQFIDAGYATDLSPVLKDTDWGNSFAPAALDALESDGKTYGVPLDLDAKVWIYNKEAFKKAGLEVPKTFDDLVDSCSALKKAGYPSPVAFGNQDGWPAVQYLTQLNPQRVPAETLNADYSGDDPQYTDPGYVEALQDFQRITKECLPSGANAVSDQTATANFLAGKSAMYYTESLAFGQFSEAGGAPKGFDKTWSFFRMPEITGAKGDQETLAGAPDGFFVNSQSKQKALAVDFLKFLTSKENGSALLEDLGWLSAVKGTTEGVDTIPQQGQLQEMISEAPSMAIWLDTVTPPDVAQAYLSGTEGMLDGSLTPEQVMDKVRSAAKASAGE